MVEDRPRFPPGFPADAVPRAFWPDDVLGRPVWDVAGHTVGRVAACSPADGPVARFEVEPTEKMRERLGEERLYFAWSDVVAAGDAVTLRDEARYLLHPEDAPASHER